MTHLAPHQASTNFITVLKVLLLLSFGALLGACSTTKALNATQQNQSRTLQQQVQLQGRISIQYQQNDQPQTVIVNFDWQQTPQDLHITLSSPLGQTIATVQENASGARLEQAKQEPRSAADIESLLVENLGWTIPVRGLKVWLQGFDLAANGQAIALPASDYYRLQSQGWQLDFVSWQVDAGIIHPKRIDLYKNTEQVGEMNIRIVIEEQQ